MKLVRFVLFMTSLLMAAFAQNDAPNANAPKAAAQKAPATPPSPARISFESLKQLAGEWEGLVTVDPPMPQWNNGKPVKLHVTMRVTSRGNLLVHEFQEAGTVLDFMKYDHPVTMIYVDNDQLDLIHYCDAGNRPRMIAKPAADEKKIEFEFADISGPTKYGHMHHAIFIPGDQNHHTEEWTFMLPGDKHVSAKMELTRTTGPIAGAIGK